MQSAQLVKAFAATVQASLHELRLLYPLLGQERAALSGRDPEQLNRVTADKLAALKALEPSVKARDRLLAAAGLPIGIDGGQQLVDQVADEALTSEWQTLTTLAADVTELNNVNAQLLTQSQRAARTALGILTGRPERNDTYSGLRRRSASGTSQELGKV